MSHLSEAYHRSPEPGLAEALRLGLDPDEIVRCWSVRWTQDGRYHHEDFVSNGEAHGFVLTLSVLGVSAIDRYVVGTSAPRRDVHPPMGSEL